MKLLLTGLLPYSIWSIAERLARGGHQVTVIGQAQEAGRRIPGVSHVKMNRSGKEPRQFVAAMGFDAILFFFAFQCEDRKEYGSAQGAQMDYLFDILRSSGKDSVPYLVLITDQRVFGNGQQAREDETPIPDSTTGVMIRAAESCVLCGAPEGVKTLIVRTTSLYEEGDPASFFSGAAGCARRGEELVLYGSEDTPCDFLHAEDLGVFLDYAVSRGMEGIAHAAQGSGATYGTAVREMRRFLPGLSVVYIPEQRCQSPLRGTAASGLGWVPRHDWRQELEELCAPPREEKPKPVSQRGDRLKKHVVRWAEVALFFLAAAWLTGLGEKNAILTAVDYMLLYVIVMGFAHGRAAGGAAALLACVWYGVSFARKGNEPSDLLFNTDHWLPMSVYLLAGTLFGYVQDRQRARQKLLAEEREEILHERDFMEGMVQRTYEDRNQLKEQIYHYRDSYGRIYQITKELDTLQPVQVFLSTLHVLETTLSSQNVAIYEAKTGSSYLRLVVRSREMRQLPKSLNLNDYGPLREALSEGRMFANHSLLNGYPAYALPVMSGDEMLAVLMLWNVSFEQQSIYMENLLRVVAGLVQSALTRAIQYHEQISDLYYDNTHILTPEALRAALGVYQAIRQRRTGEHILVRLHPDREMSMEVFDRVLGKLVRSTDLVGCMEGEYYVLFPQASSDSFPALAARFGNYGIRCELVAEDMSFG